MLHTSFADGELYCRIEESVRGCDTFIVQPTCNPVNDNLMKLLITIDAAKRASAGNVTAVMPYFGYSRQEKKSTGREPITAKLVANLIVKSGANRVMTVDMHDPALQGFFDIPVDHLSAGRMLAEHFMTRDLTNFVVVSPDTGGVLRARQFANKLHLPMAIIDKRRPEANKAEVMHVIGDVSDKHAIIIDDIIDTAGTLCTVAETLMKTGAKSVVACCTHALLSDPASERIQNSPVNEIVCTNSVPISPEKKEKCNLTILSLAPLIGEAIRRIYERRSVSELFL
ncbi:MAG: ribose-phosphate pyrophosphokinae [Clostridiales bacterium]|nr:ribose-phosphate pyrophosphokinae [Clostridiales bacterium]MDN5282637.1 ribose-phosphate pyrophosphokinae [Candidatus Ozemobacter sp.]